MPAVADGPPDQTASGLLSLPKPLSQSGFFVSCSQKNELLPDLKRDVESVTDRFIREWSAGTTGARARFHEDGAILKSLRCQLEPWRVRKRRHAMEGEID